MTVLTWSYLIYLAVGAAATWGVARTLRKNGTIVLLDGSPRKSDLAAAVADLLIVGFYLVNFGFISFWLTTSTPVVDVEEGIELLSSKLGSALVMLGVVHFVAVASLAAARSSIRADHQHANASRMQ
ncbi:MAG: hypothetical protein ACK5Q5_17350 [Planctomycetaceae bacterium]